MQQVHSFTCEFYLADNLQPINTVTCSFSNWEIKQFGSLYGETLLLSLDRHYNLYKKNPKTPIHNTYKGQSVGKFVMLDFKKKAPLVSGSIGEALSILALSACCNKPINTFAFQRFTASKAQCPDYRIETVRYLFKTLWNISDQELKRFPKDIPMEVKSNLKTSLKYPKEALDQLISYWSSCMTNYPKGVGYGIVCRANLGTNTLRYFLFIPKRGITTTFLMSQDRDVHYTNPGRCFKI